MEAGFYTLCPFLADARYAKINSTLLLVAKLKSAPKLSIGIHAGFVALLFAVLRGSEQVYPSFPGWLRELSPKGFSVFDVALFMVVVVMLTVERKWILKLKPPEVTAPGGSPI